MARTVVRIPINNVKGGGDYTGEIRVGSQGTVANVILDTGSSTLAVMPRVYDIDADKNVSFTSYAQAVKYGTGGWTGPVLETTLSMGSGGNEAEVKSYIAIADVSAYVTPARISMPRPSRAGAASISPTARSRCCRGRCRRISARSCPTSCGSVCALT